MCDTCGCGLNNISEDHISTGKTVQLTQDILGQNDRLAGTNRRLFDSMGVVTMNLVSSPGAGKTTLLERTIRDLKSNIPIGVIEGDQQTDRDAERIRATGVPAYQIKTMDACHLDAHMVKHALENFQMDTLELLFIENVGNLICPSAFDLGEDHRVIILSITEGEDKALKYPGIFLSSQLVILNKIDLLNVLNFDLNECISYINRVNPGVEILCVSAETGEGMSKWYNWLKQKIDNKRRKK